MTHKLFEYYRRELSYLYEAGREFASEHPEAAGLLDTTATPEEDPFVRRLVESFAFLNARTQLKLDEDFPQIAVAMLETLMPLWTRPLPAFGVVEFEVEPQVAGKVGGELLPRLTTRLEIPSMPGVSLRTAYDTVCSAIEITDCQLRRSFTTARHPLAGKSVSVMKLSIAGAGGLPIRGLVRDRIRFYIASPDYQFEIHEFLLNRENLLGISVAFGEQHLTMNTESLRNVGFQADEMVLDSPLSLPLEYQTVLELFAFPGKHMFFDLLLPDAVRKSDAASIDFYFFFNSARERLEVQMGRETFRLNCAPVVNLFPVGPIGRDVDRFCVDTLIDANQFNLDCEIYALDRFRGMTRGGEFVELKPLYSVANLRHDPRGFYHAQRRPRSRGDGSDLFVSIVDLDLNPYHEFGYSQIEFTATCCNRRFTDLKNADSSSHRMKVTSEGLINRANLVSSWERMQLPPFESKALWSLVSLLNLNHLVFHEQHALEALKQVLTLMNRTGRPLVTDWIGALSRVTTERVVDRVEDGPWAAVAKGLKIDIQLDATRDRNPGSWFLFAMAIDRFAALHASINSFTLTAFRSSESGQSLATFEKQCGKKKTI